MVSWAPIEELKALEKPEMVHKDSQYALPQWRFEQSTLMPYNRVDENEIDSAKAIIFNKIEPISTDAHQCSAGAYFQLRKSYCYTNKRAYGFFLPNNFEFYVASSKAYHQSYKCYKLNPLMTYNAILKSPRPWIPLVVSNTRWLYILVDDEDTWL